MPNSVKSFYLLVALLLISSLGQTEVKPNFVDEEVARVKIMSEDSKLDVETWLKYHSELDNRCSFEAAKVAPEVETVVCPFYYGLFQIGKLFLNHPANRTQEICDKYLRKQELSKEESIHQYLETIVDKLCIKK